MVSPCQLDELELGSRRFVVKDELRTLEKGLDVYASYEQLQALGSDVKRRIKEMKNQIADAVVQVRS